jgi:hypothetical protein
MLTMSGSALAAISTLAWVALVGVIIGLFGREEGGAWSIASGVARGVRDWTTERRRPPRSPARSSSSPKAELEELS